MSEPGGLAQLTFEELVRGYYREASTEHLSCSSDPPSIEADLQAEILCRMAHETEHVKAAESALMAMWQWVLVIETAVRRTDPGHYDGVIAAIKQMQEVVKARAAAEAVKP